MCTLYVKEGFKNEETRYGDMETLGERVKKLYGKADVKSILESEMAACLGRTMVCGKSIISL